MKQRPNTQKLRRSTWILGILTLAALICTMPLLGCKDYDDESLYSPPPQHQDPPQEQPVDTADEAYIDAASSDETNPPKIVNKVQSPGENKNPWNFPQGHTHQWQTKWTFDKTYHWHACSGCDQIKDKGKHAYSWKHNGSKHWKQCVCGAKIEMTDHDYGWEHNGSKHWQQCVCGAKRQEGEHRYGTGWLSNGTTHWHGCICGATADGENHSYWEGESWDKNITHHWYVCKKCGHEISGTRAPHSFGDQWGWDENGHFHRCEDCYMEVDRAPHQYEDKDDPDCNACGFTRHEAIVPDI